MSRAVRKLEARREQGRIDRRIGDLKSAQYARLQLVFA
jgi:hypothetical protein